MIDDLRLQNEMDALKRYLHPNAFRFMDIGTPNPYFVCGVKTNNGKLYTLRINLDEFPESVPKVFVMQMLKTKTGEEMSDCSASMHTLTSENGWTRICHYGNNWKTNVSLWRVIYKCLLWLNMYELHLQTGEDIDTYLNHQPM